MEQFQEWTGVAPSSPEEESADTFFFVIILILLKQSENFFNQVNFLDVGVGLAITLAIESCKLNSNKHDKILLRIPDLSSLWSLEKESAFFSSALGENDAVHGRNSTEFLPP